MTRISPACKAMNVVRQLRKVNWKNVPIVRRGTRLDVFNCSVLGSNKIDDKIMKVRNQFLFWQELDE